jgi:hypothetical protein
MFYSLYWKPGKVVRKFTAYMGAVCSIPVFIITRWLTLIYKHIQTQVLLRAPYGSCLCSLCHNTVPLSVYEFIPCWRYRALKVTAILDTTTDRQRRLLDVTRTFVWGDKRCDVIVPDPLRCCQSDSSVQHATASYLSHCLGRVDLNIVFLKLHANVLTNPYFLSKFFYSPTDTQLNCLKNNFKIYMKV